MNSKNELMLRQQLDLKLKNLVKDEGFVQIVKTTLAIVDEYRAYIDTLEPINGLALLKELLDDLEIGIIQRVFNLERFQNPTYKDTISIQKATTEFFARELQLFPFNDDTYSALEARFKAISYKKETDKKYQVVDTLFKEIQKENKVIAKFMKLKALEKALPELEVKAVMMEQKEVFEKNIEAAILDFKKNNDLKHAKQFENEFEKLKNSAKQYTLQIFIEKLSHLSSQCKLEKDKLHGVERAPVTPPKSIAPSPKKEKKVEGKKEEEVLVEENQVNGDFITDRENFFKTVQSQLAFFNFNVEAFLSDTSKFIQKVKSKKSFDKTDKEKLEDESKKIAGKYFEKCLKDIQNSFEEARTHFQAEIQDIEAEIKKSELNLKAEDLLKNIKQHQFLKTTFDFSSIKKYEILVTQKQGLDNLKDDLKQKIDAVKEIIKHHQNMKDIILKNNIHDFFELVKEEKNHEDLKKYFINNFKNELILNCKNPYLVSEEKLAVNGLLKFITKEEMESIEKTREIKKINEELSFDFINKLLLFQKNNSVDFNDLKEMSKDNESKIEETMSVIEKLIQNGDFEGSIHKKNLSNIIIKNENINYILNTMNLAETPLFDPWLAVLLKQNSEFCEQLKTAVKSDEKTQKNLTFEVMKSFFSLPDSFKNNQNNLKDLGNKILSGIHSENDKDSPLEKLNDFLEKNHFALTRNDLFEQLGAVQKNPSNAARAYQLIKGLNRQFSNLEHETLLDDSIKDYRKRAINLVLTRLKEGKDNHFIKKDLMKLAEAHFQYRGSIGAFFKNLVIDILRPLHHYTAIPQVMFSNFQSESRVAHGLDTIFKNIEKEDEHEGDRLL